MINVFHNHNGIIHHKANRQDHRKQGQYIDRESAQVKHKEAADHRYRHHHHRNQRRATFTEECKDNRNHQQERNEDCLHHFFNGCTDIDRGIAAIKDIDAFGDFTTDIFYALVEFIGYFHVI